MGRGDLAVVRLIWTLTVTDADNKVVETTKGRGIDIFRRQADGGLEDIAVYCLSGERELTPLRGINLQELYL